MDTYGLPMAADYYILSPIHLYVSALCFVCLLVQRSSNMYSIPFVGAPFLTMTTHLHRAAIVGAGAAASALAKHPDKFNVLVLEEPIAGGIH